MNYPANDLSRLDYGCVHVQWAEQDFYEDSLVGSGLFLILARLLPHIFATQATVIAIKGPIGGNSQGSGLFNELVEHIHPSPDLHHAQGQTSQGKGRCQGKKHADFWNHEVQMKLDFKIKKENKDNNKGCDEKKFLGKLLISQSRQKKVRSIVQ